MIHVMDIAGPHRKPYGIAPRLRECCPDKAHRTTRGGQT
jgi:hypothetical protein